MLAGIVCGNYIHPYSITSVKGSKNCSLNY